MKKVLIITYYWPPAGGGGVYRALKFVKYLGDFGWEPIILTVENPDAPTYDNTLLNEIPIGTKVFKTKSLEPFLLYKKFIGKKKYSVIPNNILASSREKSIKERFAEWVRLNIFIPDAKIGWKYFAVKKGFQIIKKEKIDVIYSTSPPPTVALIAQSLAKKTKVKWLADFRDPWMEIVYYQNVRRSWITKKIDSKLERSVLNGADSILTTAPNVVKLFESKVGKQNYNVITNGYDESDFENINTKINENFTIVYTGSMSSDRVPYSLFPAIKKFIDSQKDVKLKFKFAGSYSEEFYIQLKKHNLSNFFELQEFIPHKESTRLLQSADALLLVVDKVPNNNIFIPGKIFEYFGAKKPIIAIGPKDSEADKILQESGAGKMIGYDDTIGIFSLLKIMYNDWGNCKKINLNSTEKFSRKNLTEELSVILNNLIYQQK